MSMNRINLMSQILEFCGSRVEITLVAGALLPVIASPL